MLYLSSLISLQAFGLFPLWAFMSNASIKICVQGFVGTYFLPQRFTMQLGATPETTGRPPASNQVLFPGPAVSGSLTGSGGDPEPFSFCY